MSTIIPFIPSNIKPYSIPVILDYDNYKLVVTWNISAQRYYINIYSNDGTWIVTTPLVMTPPSRRLATAVFNPFRLVLEIGMVDPTLWPIPLSPGGLATKPGTVIDYTLEGFTPDTYNGLYRGIHVNETSFTVPMNNDPGPVSIIGSVARKLNMVAGIFKTSTLVYRNNAFEVDP